MKCYLETSAGEASVRYELSSSKALVVQARANGASGKAGAAQYFRSLTEKLRLSSRSMRHSMAIIQLFLPNQIADEP